MSDKDTIDAHARRNGWEIIPRDRFISVYQKWDHGTLTCDWSVDNSLTYVGGMSAPGKRGGVMSEYTRMVPFALGYLT